MTLTFQRDRGSPTPLIINASNEWTECSCLEPDRRYGHAYLEQLMAAVTAE